ncbi:prepilin-type N-terminal cleavage/methylation domain-containing protein [Glaciecola sp. 2405UD65-10]|uniref:prepilin-type N-terminal cleavage/methylation domain-containing protein n=1 Tax=Glaciecola sp. 2405UD65-10 TaxID=3397244 RepID=UPI003B5C9493
MQFNRHSFAEKQSGFTLIELIIVIVILGVLAVSAAPRFINISTEANVSTLQNMGAAIMATANMVRAKASIQGVEKMASASVDLNGDGEGDIATVYGYPQASRVNGLSTNLNADFENQWGWATTYGLDKFYVASEAATGIKGFKVNRQQHFASNCYLVYSNASSAGSEPTIEYELSGC